jgi:hypothetical protein
MRGEREIAELKDKLEKMTGFIADYGSEEEFNNKDVSYACDVIDALDWVLGLISTEHFLSDSYLNLAGLQKLVKEVEKRAGKKLQMYE